MQEESQALNKTCIDYDDLAKLEGIGLAMKEALRLCAPVPSLPRKTVRDAEFNGYFIPKGTFISVSPFFTHYMEEFWPEPETFDPERFSEARREDKIHPCLGAVWRRGSQVHWSALRRDAGQSDTPSSITELSLERAGQL